MIQQSDFKFNKFPFSETIHFADCKSLEMLFQKEKTLFIPFKIEVKLL
jgi:hypothetical protein